MAKLERRDDGIYTHFESQWEKNPEPRKLSDEAVANAKVKYEQCMTEADRLQTELDNLEVQRTDLEQKLVEVNTELIDFNGVFDVEEEELEIPAAEGEVLEGSNEEVPSDVNQ